MAKISPYSQSTINHSLYILTQTRSSQVRNPAPVPFCLLTDTRHLTPIVSLLIHPPYFQKMSRLLLRRRQFRQYRSLIRLPSLGTRLAIERLKRMSDPALLLQWVRLPGTALIFEIVPSPLVLSVNRLQRRVFRQRFSFPNSIFHETKLRLKLASVRGLSASMTLTEA